ncbi:MAG: PhnE/PtxC family ABC transporter permease, partial [Candidatus Rokuibacteriota bacterium]
AIAASLAAFAARDILFDRAALVADPAVRRLGRRAVYAGARMVLSVLRTVPEIVWALLFVFAVGLGPFPGVLALGLHTGGVLGKLFGEVLEDVGAETLESLRSCGASPITVLAYGILPQALPQCIAYSLYRWEVNIRAAAVLGFVGAGGLGQQIHVAINLFLEHRLLTLIAAIYLTVTLVDALSLAVRRRWS